MTQNLIDYSPAGLLYEHLGGDGPLSQDINDLAVDAKDTALDAAQDVGGFITDAGKSALGVLGF